MPNFSPSKWERLLPEEVRDGPCAPIALGNIIKYLARHGRIRLISPQGNLSEQYSSRKLVETLAVYIDTDSFGTTPANLIEGLEAYVKDRGYNISMKWFGNCYSGKHKSTKGFSPELIMEGSINPCNSILWVGHCSRYPGKNLYTRDEGHAVTVAGFNSVSREILVHDSCSSKTPVVWRLSPLDSGSISYEDTKKLQAAKNYLGIGLARSYLPAKSDSKLNIVEGSLSFEVFPK